MICPNLDHAPHHRRGALGPGYLPLGTMCETTDGNFTCFDCLTKIPGGQYATELGAKGDALATYHGLRAVRDES